MFDCISLSTFLATSFAYSSLQENQTQLLHPILIVEIWGGCLLFILKGRSIAVNTVEPLLLFLKILFPRISKADMEKLISSVSANVSIGESEDRQMITGMHTVADIFCVGCGSHVGWTYVTAHEKSQKYKEGKSVLERFKMSGPEGNNNYWVRHETHVGGSDADDS